MAGFASLALRVGPLTVLLLACGVAGGLAQERVGVSSAVNPEALGTPPGGVRRQLVIGQNVLFRERITTGSAGQTQLLFLDESSMTIGPNSDLTIDQFVYDPKSGTGKLAMSATRGLLRYVGGKLSKQNDGVTMRTSTATLAVRGGAFIVHIGVNGGTEAIFIYGNGLTVTGLNGISQTLLRPGFAVVVNHAGAPPSTPFPVPEGELTQLLAQLDGRPGGTGGAPVVPTDATVAGSGISQTVSGNLDQSLQQALQNRFTPQPRTIQVTSLQGSFNPQPNQVISCAVSLTCKTPLVVGATNTGVTIGGGSIPSPPRSNPPPSAPPTVTVTYGGQLKKTDDPAHGFVDQSTLARPGANGQIAYAGGTLSFPDGSPQSGVFTGTFGALGRITFPLVPGSASFGPQGTSSNLGTFTGTSFLSSDDTFFYANVTPTSQPTERLLIFGGTRVSPSFYQQTGNTRLFAFSVQPDPVLQSNIPFIRSQVGGNLPNASVSPLFVVAPPKTPIGDATTASAARALQASLAIDSQGANQKSVIAVTAGTIDALEDSGQTVLSGHLRASALRSSADTPLRIGTTVSSTVDANGNSFYGGNAISGFVLDQSSPNGAPGSGVVSGPVPNTATEIPLSGSRAQYGFAQVSLPTPVPSSVNGGRTTGTISGYFGGLMYTTAQKTPYSVGGNAFISTEAATNRVQAMLNGNALSPSSGVNTLVMQFGGLVGNAGGREAFIDDNTFAALESQVNPQQINGQPLVVDGDPGQAGKLYLVSSGAAGAPSSLLPPNTSYCDCQYLKWGYWGGDLLTGNSSDMSISRIDRGHINTWVAGLPTPLSDINSLIGQSATASYTGHAIGSVFNNGLSYLAAGGFTGTYNFGTQSGSFAITNFDGHSFAGRGSAPLTGSNYSFSLNQPGLSGKVNGTFLGPMAAETGGNFSVQATVGPTYIASGIFAGKR